MHIFNRTEIIDNNWKSNEQHEKYVSFSLVVSCESLLFGHTIFRCCWRQRICHELMRKRPAASSLTIVCYLHSSSFTIPDCYTSTNKILPHHHIYFIPNRTKAKNQLSTHFSTHPKMIPTESIENVLMNGNGSNESAMCSHLSWFPDDLLYDPLDYRTQCDRPQLAHEIYRRLLTMATAAAAAATANATVTVPINQRDIMIAAYTGTGLRYQR